MLLNKQGKEVQLKPEASDHARRSVTEKLWFLPYKRHPFFRLEHRVRGIK